MEKVIAMLLERILVELQEIKEIIKPKEIDLDEAIKETINIFKGTSKIP